MHDWNPDTTSKVALPRDPVATHEADGPDWISEVRDGISAPGMYLVYTNTDLNMVAFALEREWTRIGRSLAADIRFDDPTVSRRHALIVQQADGLRVVDDRSLNGVFVNGERVEWSTLADGDEIVIGRHRLHFVEIAAPLSVGDGETLAPVAAGA
jgi:pSer/pThr/pTyr-binding forkhead associated (FHA) protein